VHTVKKYFLGQLIVCYECYATLLFQLLFRSPLLTVVSYLWSSDFLFLKFDSVRRDYAHDHSESSPIFLNYASVLLVV
jgi:hypothetical protein